MRRGIEARQSRAQRLSVERADQLPARLASVAGPARRSTSSAAGATCWTRSQPRFAICNVLHGAQIMFSEDLSAALCRAINNWIAAEWLDRDPRLRASIVVPVHSPDLAAAEIERLRRRYALRAGADAGDDRDCRWGGGRTGRSTRAAERHGLPIGIHAGSSFRHPPSALGWPSYLLEDYVSQAPGFAAALNSLVTEGVFKKFPELRSC